MKPIYLISAAAVGLVWWLFDTKEVNVTIKPKPPEPPKPTQDEVSRVMSHLGKKSGKARGKATNL
jgi:hypothetical protein